ncbi:Hypothetical predicted protein [Mytilus galloprovincialis]|uniref:C1q domain-containing protein n=1 Tax=Mytilus galloprovincialis TaxID=29158 RepID=A0A8B6ER11_MYTGA|nr:Hypothetical predicted protein [Mytilus galloprovincialis]
MEICTGMYFIAFMCCSFGLGKVETAANQNLDEMVDFRKIREIKTVKEILKSATIEIEKLKDQNDNLQTAMIKMETKHTDELTEMKIDLETLKSICQHQDVSAKKLHKDRSLQVFTDNFSFEVENHTKIHPSPEFRDEDKGTLFNIVEPKSRLYEEKCLLLPQITTPGAILTKVAFYARVKESMHDLGFNQAISFESVVLDTHNAFHGTSGVFTAPRAGNYAFWGNVVCYPN